MSISETVTETYSAVDVGKVLDCFAADFDGISQSTGLRTRDNVQATSADVKLWAINDYISEVNIYLKDAAGNIVRAAKYEVLKNAGGLTAQRPGNFLWPKTPGGSLCILIVYTTQWYGLTDQQRLSFRQKLAQQWGTSDVDTTFPGLTRSLDRTYASNSYGMNKSIFQ